MEAREGYIEMNKVKKKWLKALLITAIIAAALTAGGWLFLQYLKSELKAKLAGCTLESANFTTVLDFEYVNHWIVVKVKLDGSDKEYPFLFDTGAQTVILDSLLKEIRKEGITAITSGSKKDTIKHAFKSEIVTLKGLHLGDVRFRNIGAITAKNPEWGMLNCITPYGIIGYNVIQTCCFQIDYIKKQIIITDRVDDLGNFQQISWVPYKSVANMETPLIPAMINDNIKVDLFFDTGKSGGITLTSSKLFRTIEEKYPDRTAKFIYSPSIRVRGEEQKPVNSMVFKASIFKLGNSISENVKILVDDVPEREFSGSAGNRYFEKFIITLDYKNKRIGFIPNASVKGDDFTTFGLSYIPDRNSLLVSSVYPNAEPARQGIIPGDEIVSVNGVNISELPSDVFCKIYRDEFKLINSEDSILVLEIRKKSAILKYRFKKFQAL